MTFPTTSYQPFQSGIYSPARDNNVKSSDPLTTPVKRIPDDVIDDVAALRSVTWKDIGYKLNIGHNILNIIEIDNSRSVKNATMQMFEEWVKSGSKATPAALCAALDDPHIGFGRLSQHIKDTLKTNPDYFSESPRSSSDSRSAAADTTGEITQRQPPQFRKITGGSVNKFAVLKSALQVKESELQQKNQELKALNQKIATSNERVQFLESALIQVKRENAALTSWANQLNLSKKSMDSELKKQKTDMQQVKNENEALKAQIASMSAGSPASASHSSSVATAGVKTVKSEGASGDKFLTLLKNKDLGKERPSHLYINQSNSKFCLHWKKIALFLNVSQSRIDIINIDNQNDVQQKCYLALTKWLEKDTEASHRKLAEAVYEALKDIEDRQKATDYGCKIINKQPL